MSIRSKAFLPAAFLALTTTLSAQGLPSDVIEFIPGTKAMSSQVNFNFDLVESSVRDIAMYVDNGDGTFTYDPITGTVKRWSLNKVDSLLNEVFPTNFIDPLNGFLNLGESAISINAAGVAANGASILVLDSRMGIAEGRLDGHDSDIAGLISDIALLTADLDALELDVDAIVQEIGANSLFAGQTIWDVINQMSQGHNNQETRLLALESTVAALQSAMQALQTDMAQAQADILANTAAIAQNASDIAALDVRVADLEAQLLQAQADIAALDVRVTDLEARMDMVEADVLANAAAIAQNLLDISDNATAIATNAAEIVLLQGRMDTAEADIDALEMRMDSAEAQITQNTLDIASLVSDMAAALVILNDHELQITQNAVDILANSGRLDGHDAMLSDHEGRIMSLESTVADHTTQLDDHENRITDNEAMLVDHEQRLVDLEYWASLVTPHGQQTFFSDTTWNVPEGVDTFYVTVIGAGGGAAKRGLGIPGDFAGGDGASYWKTEVVGVLAGDQVNITIGQGGGSVIGSPSQGQDGGSSTVEFVASAVTITAEGGKGGIADAVQGGTPGMDGAPLEGMVLRYNGQGAETVLDAQNQQTFGNPGMVLIEW